MSCFPLPDEAARLVIDAQTILAELTRVKAHARQYEGGMHWKQDGAYEDLVKTGRGKRQQRLGPRSPELEAGAGEEGETRRFQMLGAAGLRRRRHRCCSCSFSAPEQRNGSPDRCPGCWR